jgi:SAM-dependent methyltransferase
MIRSKVLDMQDLLRTDFKIINDLFNKQFGNNWPQVPLRRWEYVAAIVFTDILKHDRNKKVLEAGCGNSVFAPFIAEKGFAVDAFDYKINLSPNKNYGESGILRYHNMSNVDIKFDDNSFDFVFCISVIEHINAGRFKIDGFPFDVGDTQAMKELVRVLKPGGILCLTTDFADRYYLPPGLWKDPCHRIYDKTSFMERLVTPCNIEFYEEVNFVVNKNKLNQMEPVGYDYTEAIATFKKI